MQRDILQSRIRSYIGVHLFGMGLYLLQLLVCSSSEGADAQARLGLCCSPIWDKKETKTLIKENEKLNVEAALIQKSRSVINDEANADV